ncbi:MAG: DEAD/DEAH box helicase [Desulfovibrio sp.]|jgi:non-specific serine/threonine protein kinase|nr:DEAD/DEAH box helicase [Desulfovibrio sp.]
MIRITLTPWASLVFSDTTAGPEATLDAEDWRSRLFGIAAKKTLPECLPEDVPSVRFWSALAEDFITFLCHMQESPVDKIRDDILVSLPVPSRLDKMVENAPPMPGGEYLTWEALENIWGQLAEWCADALLDAPSLAAFLDALAPKWRRVGRVAFHLAENKGNDALPFAFLVTYTVGLGNAGQPRHRTLGNALIQYAQEDDRTALLSLLSPVKAAAEQLPWVNRMTEDQSIYLPRPLPFKVSQAYQMLKDVPVLEQCGLMVSIPDWWRKRQRPTVQVTIGKNEKTLFGLEDLLDWNISLALGEQALTQEDIQELLQGDDGLILFKGEWVEVDREKLQQALDHWKQVRKQLGDGISLADAMRLLSGMPAGTTEAEGKSLESCRDWTHAVPGEALRKLLERLRTPEEAPSPAGLQATLRHYQLQGLAWLTLLCGMGLGACLADDMGLGKTIQILALLLHLKNRDSASPTKNAPPPSLLVVPASILGNWRAEAKRFAPRLTLHFYHPAECDKDTFARWGDDPRALAKSDLVVTSYSMLARNADFFAGMKWRLVIADEAQNIKNPGTRQTKALKRLKAETRIALTGTPIENRLADLWSIFDFINPGLLGSAKQFKQVLKHLEEHPEKGYAPLRRLAAPYILRRMKTDKRIIDDLPDKIESVVYCHLTAEQAKLYSSIVNQMKESLRDFAQSEEDTRTKRRALVLTNLMRLKQICNHPSQLTGTPDWDPEMSGKFQRVAELCQEMAERQERVLVFSQFRETIDPLHRHLEKIFGRPGLVLHGGVSVKSRQGLVDAFQRNDGPPFFILSLRAGGTGLNLTAAGHVIHFDRWWNPAVEDQATDRTFRIGQKKNVLVHKCVTRGTLEERIDRMLVDKRMLADEILDSGEEINVTKLNDDELLRLVSLDISTATL